MRRYSGWSALVLIGMLALPGRSAAEQVRFHFAPVDPTGRTQQVAIGPDGAIGEKIMGVGLIPKPFRETYRPTHMVTFRHPYNARNIIVPLTLPAGTPRMENRSDRIIYHFGAYQIVVRFIPDGSVDVIYNSGFLRVAQQP
jgi:hypothetical protein